MPVTEPSSLRVSTAWPLRGKRGPRREQLRPSPPASEMPNEVRAYCGCWAMMEIRLGSAGVTQHCQLPAASVVATTTSFQANHRRLAKPAKVGRH